MEIFINRLIAKIVKEKRNEDDMKLSGLEEIEIENKEEWRELLDIFDEKSN